MDIFGACFELFGRIVGHLATVVPLHLADEKSKVFLL
jgi:hypothetical protein